MRRLLVTIAAVLLAVCVFVGSGITVAPEVHREKEKLDIPHYRKS